MAKIIKIDKTKHNSGILDPATRTRCMTEKVVDITEDCPKASQMNRAILLFVKAKRGHIVQIIGPTSNSQIRFFIDQLDREMRATPQNNAFTSTASNLGLTKPELRTIIKAHIPV